jgi:colanic acid biosynthesis glycosyl transferase WcaI
MKVLVVGLNYAPEKVGIAVYTAGMAEALVARGHEVRVIAGNPYYPAWRIADGYNAWAYSNATESGVRVTRVPHYIPAEPSGLRRLFHHASFAATALVPSLWTALTFRPDVVLTIAPSLVAAPVARLAAWVSGARSWLHIQDFEVEAAFATGLLKAEGRGARMARWFERTVLKSFDQVSSISPAMCRRLIEKGVPGTRVTELRNWADVDAIRPMSAPSPYRQQWGISTDYVALYSGNIANKQGIEIVLEAARQLQHRADLTFVVCGEGPNRANLERQATGLSNVQFHDLQPKERLNDLLALATVHLLPQIAGAADLVLPSKLTNMLASGRPVVATAENGSGLYDEVEGCGLLVRPGDAPAFAGAISRLLDNRELSSALGATARQRAEEHWAKRAILKRASDIMETGATAVAVSTRAETIR